MVWVNMVLTLNYHLSLAPGGGSSFQRALKDRNHKSTWINLVMMMVLLWVRSTWGGFRSCWCVLGFVGLDINSSSGKCQRKATTNEMAPSGLAGEARMGLKSRVSFQHSECHRHLINKPTTAGRKAKANECPTEYCPLVDINLDGGPL